MDHYTHITHPCSSCQEEEREEYLGIFRLSFHSEMLEACLLLRLIMYHSFPYCIQLGDGGVGQLQQTSFTLQVAGAGKNTSFCFSFLNYHYQNCGMLHTPPWESTHYCLPRNLLWHKRMQLVGVNGTYQFHVTHHKITRIILYKTVLLKRHVDMVL